MRPEHAETDDHHPRAGPCHRALQEASRGGGHRLPDAHEADAGGGSGVVNRDDLTIVFPIE